MYLYLTYFFRNAVHAFNTSRQRNRPCKRKKCRPTTTRIGLCQSLGYSRSNVTTASVKQHKSCTHSIREDVKRLNVPNMGNPSIGAPLEIFTFIQIRRTRRQLGMVSVIFFVDYCFFNNKKYTMF